VKPRSAVILFLITNLSFSAVQVAAYVVEPLLVETTELSLTFDDLTPNAPPVRIVHLSDIHVERYSFRELQVSQKVNALQPDIIVLTGDYLNLSRLGDPTSAAHFRRFVTQLEAPYGIYAVRGSVEPTLDSMDWLVEGTDIVWLEQEAVKVDVRGQSVTLVGAACSHQQELDAARLAQAMDGVSKDDFTLLLYHSPDLILEATEHQIDLYLGGHTHGRQLRLPFYGAIVTGSIYGKQYVSGLFENDGTTMYISRGIGFEGGGMPRARFLSRPEIVNIELQGKNTAND
jgi:predicted MPP superfamily phosphohydrolase